MLIIKKLEDTKLFYNHKELGKHLNQNYLKIENCESKVQMQDYLF